MKTRCITLLFSLILAIVLTTGCNSSYGVIRTAQLRTMPSPALVGETIKSVTGVEAVKYRLCRGMHPMTVTGIHPPDVVHAFNYSGSNIFASLVLRVNFEGQVEFSQILLRTGTSPPKSVIDATRAAMKEIELRLAQRCGLPALKTGVSEKCLRVQCD